MATQEKNIADDVRKFIFDYLDSIEQLEVLLLLRDRKDRTWNAHGVNAELRSDPSSVAQRMENLHARGLLKKNPGPQDEFQYAPPSTAVDATIGNLATAYKERRFTVIQLIFSKPTDTLRTFADAFRLKRDDHDR